MSDHDPATGVRLQKLLADAGQGSRRTIDGRIAAGEVTLNGRTAEPGATAAEGDRLEMGDKGWTVTRGRARHRTLIYNKPEGELTTRNDPQGRPTVFDRLPPLKGQRWVAVGRLDINTTGLLLLTTDGELAHAMMHPSSNVDREYACRVRGPVAENKLRALRDGVEIDIEGQKHTARFSDIQPAGASGQNQWFHVTIMEGRNREVRRLWEAVGAEVSRLKRVRYGAAFLPKGLRMGQWQALEPADHRVLREDVGLASEAVQLQLVPDSVRPEGRKRRPPRKPRRRR